MAWKVLAERSGSTMRRLPALVWLALLIGCGLGVTVRDADAWEEWVAYMLTAVEESAREAIQKAIATRSALFDLKHRIRSSFRFYSQDLINNLFMHPYTKIQYLQDDLRVSRLTATKYLDQLAGAGFLEKHRVGRSNYYMNTALVSILVRDSMSGEDRDERFDRRPA